VGFSLIVVGVELYYYTEYLGSGAWPDGTAWINGRNVTIWVAGFAFPIQPYSGWGLRGIGCGTVIVIATLLESLVGKRTKSIVGKIHKGFENLGELEN
jgi:hypothetical protein